MRIMRSVIRYAGIAALSLVVALMMAWAALATNPPLPSETLQARPRLPLCGCHGCRIPFFA